MSNQDRRRSSRSRFAATAALFVHGRLLPNDQALCSVLNISRHGVGLETGQPPREGQHVLVRLAVGDEIHELQATTQRVEPIENRPNFYEVGLEWSQCSPKELEFLNRFVEKFDASPLA